MSNSKTAHSLFPSSPFTVWNYLVCLLAYCSLSAQGGKCHSIRDLVRIVHSYILSVLSRTWQIAVTQQIFVEWGNELNQGDSYIRQRSETEQNSEVWNYLCAWENLCFQWLKPKEESKRRWEPRSRNYPLLLLLLLLLFIIIIIIVILF